MQHNNYAPKTPVRFQVIEYTLMIMLSARIILCVGHWIHRTFQGYFTGIGISMHFPDARETNPDVEAKPVKFLFGHREIPFADDDLKINWHLNKLASVLHSTFQMPNACFSIENFRNLIQISFCFFISSRGRGKDRITVGLEGGS